MSHRERRSQDQRPQSEYDRPYSPRSRSPNPRSSSHRHRSQSPQGSWQYRHHHSSRHKHERRVSPRPQALPFNSSQLSRHDLIEYKPMFGLYLDIQKQLILEDLQDAEVKGRWKRFVGKWNRGELAEGWYDPSTKQKAIASASIEEASSEVRTRRPQDSPEFGVERKTRSLERDNESDDDVVGPALPGYEPKDRRVGPAIPNMQDLALQRELALDDRNAARDDIRYARKLDRKQQKEQVDDLVPRAEAGTRERQLEKKKEVNDKMRSFREKSPSAVEEVGEGELMGDDGVEGLKAKKKEFERKKNEREIRKEEMLRARAEEREERLQEHRAKEDKTMAMLKALAKQNFG